ncbi:MAG: hypothetical protein HXX08_24930 [Chloroflexi bacterium]|uniref:Uncharacterized protein n=1 Tax=Candidatus Chlorohelix allophototropha TaxID=3003348 RepID=A0A8T7MAF9_9CHLR|nr:hypothetical protein [Chloroflexota bacterium]WJW70425.1 hypothetical protein OZ401_005109 [Chloroflexota bacterium L227-S17]
MLVLLVGYNGWVTEAKGHHHPSAFARHAMNGDEYPVLVVVVNTVFGGSDTDSLFKCGEGSRFALHITPRRKVAQEYGLVLAGQFWAVVLTPVVELSVSFCTLPVQDSQMRRGSSYGADRYPDAIPLRRVSPS